MPWLQCVLGCTFCWSYGIRALSGALGDCTPRTGSQPYWGSKEGVFRREGYGIMTGDRIMLGGPDMHDRCWPGKPITNGIAGSASSFWI